MSCDPEALKHVPLFALLDDEETAVLAGQVELKKFAPRQRIYKMGDAAGQAYVMVSGRVRVTTLDEDHQEVVVDEPGHGEFFGFASMLEQTPHQTTAIALEESQCLEVDRHDIAVLLQRKPMAGMDMLTVLGKQFHASQQLVRVRANRNPFILLNLFLSALAAIQAPVIMMSQNRQDTKDRLRSELDFDVNRRAESEIQGLARKLNLIGDKINDVEDMLRSKS